MGLTFKGTAVKRCVFNGTDCKEVYYNGNKVFDVADFLKNLKLELTVEISSWDESSGCSSKTYYDAYIKRIKITHDYGGAVSLYGIKFVSDYDNTSGTYETETQAVNKVIDCSCSIYMSTDKDFTCSITADIIIGGYKYGVTFNDVNVDVTYTDGDTSTYSTTVKSVGSAIGGWFTK